MGSECNPSRRRYDIAMSKRTRKPFYPEETDQIYTTEQMASNWRESSFSPKDRFVDSPTTEVSMGVSSFINATQQIASNLQESSFSKKDRLTYSPTREVPMEVSCFISATEQIASNWQESSFWQKGSLTNSPTKEIAPMEVSGCGDEEREDDRDRGTKKAYSEQMTSNWQKSSFSQKGSLTMKEIVAMEVLCFDDIERKDDRGTEKVVSKQMASNWQANSSPGKEIGDADKEKGDRKKFEELIKGEEKTEGSKTGRSSLGQHFTEEEKLQVVVRNPKAQGVEGLKLKGLMRRYAKVLGHLIKNKKPESRVGSSKKKPALQLTM